MMLLTEGQTCQICRIGRFQATQAVYIRQIHDQTITIPNAPAFKCDMCREVLFEPRFVQKIDYLLDQAPQSLLFPNHSHPFFEDQSIRRYATQ